MKKEFIVDRQGKPFVLYAGLLDLAHQNGLKSIKTEVVQVPTNDNGNVAIVYAIVTLEKDGIERTFTGIGDAAPNNVGPQMKTCLLRLAETRAKARGLRDSGNVGVTAVEELGEEDMGADSDLDGKTIRLPTSRPSRSAPARPAAAAQEGRKRDDGEQPFLRPGGLTRAQHGAIANLSKKLKGGLRELEELCQHNYQTEFVELTFAQAAELIRLLGARKAV